MTAVGHHASLADPVVLHRRMLQSVRAYCETRGLPADLQQRLLSYFEFQQQKAMDSDGSRILRALPDSLRMKVASHQYSYVIQRNSMLFKGCNLQFLNQLMLKLREIYLMPGETLIRAGDMSRELAFVARVCTSTSHCSITLAMTLTSCGSLLPPQQEMAPNWPWCKHQFSSTPGLLCFMSGIVCRPYLSGVSQSLILNVIMGCPAAAAYTHQFCISPTSSNKLRQERT